MLFQRPQFHMMQVVAFLAARLPGVLHRTHVIFRFAGGPPLEAVAMPAMPQVFPQPTTWQRLAFGG